MRFELSKRQWILSCLAGLLIGGIYVAFYIHVIGAAWQRKEGELPQAPDWFQNASLFMAAFPFGFFSGILLAPFLNGLFWGLLAGAGCVLWFRRRSVG